MAKLEKGHPKDTTKTGPGKDSYNTASPAKQMNPSRKSKVRQDGVGQKDSVNAGEHLWKQTHSDGNTPNTPGAGI